MKEFSSMSLEELIQAQGHNCSCGRHHKAGLRCLRIGTGAVEALPDFLAQTGVTRPFIISDPNTRGAAWYLVEPVMDTADIPYSEYVYAGAHVEPDEQALGSLVMAFDPRCDGILAMGSGVLNDLAKVFAHALRLPSLVVATAPSMDGYASDSAAMIRERVKVSLCNACPQAIIPISTSARKRPCARAGLPGVGWQIPVHSEWRISHCDQRHYRENIAGLVRASLKSYNNVIQGQEAAAVDSVTEIALPE